MGSVSSSAEVAASGVSVLVSLRWQWSPCAGSERSVFTDSLPLWVAHFSSASIAFRPLCKPAQVGLPSNDVALAEFGLWARFGPWPDGTDPFGARPLGWGRVARCLRHGSSDEPSVKKPRKKFDNKSDSKFDSKLRQSVRQQHSHQQSIKVMCVQHNYIIRMIISGNF